MAAELVKQQAPTFADSDASKLSSHVRVRSGALTSRASRRVAEYLRALGLIDSERIRELSEEIAATVTESSAELQASEAVRRAQERFESFRNAVFADVPGGRDPLWQREFLATFPDVALGDVRSARHAAQAFFDPATAGSRRQVFFRNQELEPARLASRLLSLAALGLSLCAALALALVFASHALGWLWLVWAGLFLFLSCCGAIGLLTAAFGVMRLLRRNRTPSSESATAPRSLSPAPLTALVMPIYHESAEHVFAALAAMRESLLATPGVVPEAFEVFVLSDSSDPALAAEEERAFRRVASTAGAEVPIFYRRRARNDRHKAGNLAEFFERWGHRYSYAIVLDADSVMSGATMLELVRRMQASPRLALLQAPIALTGAESLFARVLQFAASVFGPVFTSGLAAWSGAHGNYYGHNAILRVQAFLDCCALPRLEGKPPFGGDILSHDFVEAALLCRAGWEVRIADDLAGSFEGLPPSIQAYAARDRRWCQGNLQHLRVACARGLKPMSRLHLLLGAFAYLESPAWLAFIGLGASLPYVSVSPFASFAWMVVPFTLLLLLGPQLLGLMVTLGDSERCRKHGGRVRLCFGFLLQLILGAWIAPLILLHRTRIVISLLLGRSVRWGAQARAQVPGLAQLVESEGLTTLLGLGLPCLLWFTAKALVFWLAPAWIPWVLSIPLAALLSSRAAGALIRRVGGLLVPSETEPDGLQVRAHELRALTAADDSASFRDLVLDPVLLATHVARLAVDSSADRDSEAPTQLRQRALRVGPAGLSPRERRALMSDAESMRWLHREAWRHWPVESWQIARERPQIPIEGLTPRVPDLTTVLGAAPR